MAKSYTIFVTSADTSESADAPEQTIDSSDQGMSLAVEPEQIIVASAQGTSSVVVFQELTADEFAKKLSLFSELINFVAKDIPSVDLANPHQGITQIASSSQRQEIALKQVSCLS